MFNKITFSVQKYSLFVSTKIEEQKYIIEIYNRTTDKTQNIFTDIDTIFNHLI